MTRAIIFVPPGPGYEQSAAQCLDHAEFCGYQLAGIVRDWQEVHRMLGNGEVSVAIVADERDLDPQRKPRVEVVANQPAAGSSQEQQRTRLIRRNGAR